MKIPRNSVNGHMISCRIPWILGSRGLHAIIVEIPQTTLQSKAKASHDHGGSSAPATLIARRTVDKPTTEYRYKKGARLNSSQGSASQSEEEKHLLLLNVVPGRKQPIKQPVRMGIDGGFSVDCEL